MHQNDLLRIQSCNPKELERIAEAYGVAPSGPRGIWAVRRQAQSPHTGVVHYLRRSLHTTDLRSALMKAVPIVDDWLVTVKSELVPRDSDGGCLQTVRGGAFRPPGKPE